MKRFVSFGVVVGLIVLLGWFMSGLYLHDIQQARGHLAPTKSGGSPYYLVLALLAATVILAFALFSLGILLFTSPQHPWMRTAGEWTMLLLVFLFVVLIVWAYEWGPHVFHVL
jgi:hypothetical protein